MSQIRKQLELNNFSGGLNTEQSPLAADPATSMQEQNMVLASDGSRARRYGYEYESSVSIAGFDASSVGGHDADIPVQSFNNVYIRGPGVVTDQRSLTCFLAADTDATSIVMVANTPGYVYEDASSIKVEVTSLLNLVTTTGAVKGAQFGSALILPNKDRVTITNVDATNESLLTATTESLQIRDFWGVDDDLDVDERPTTLDANHAYNLLNQGWSGKDIAKFKTDIGVYPSNADASYFGRNATGDFDVELTKTKPFPDGASRGRYTIPLGNPPAGYRAGLASDQDELNTAAGTSISYFALINGTAQAPSQWACQTITSFMGRAFYTGEVVGTDRYAGGAYNRMYWPSSRNYVMFTSVLSSLETKAGSGVKTAKAPSASTCISLRSPTDEFFAPSYNDGGFVVVPDAERILGTIAVGDSLAIIATNGIWELRAADGISPSSFILSKTSSSKTHTFKSVVSVENKAFIATEDGILALYFDASSRRIAQQNVSDPAIRSFYKEHYLWFGYGAYDPAQKAVRWLLHTPPVIQPFGVSAVVEQKELVLDLRLGSFSLNIFENAVGAVRNLKFLGYPPPPNGPSIYRCPPFYDYADYPNPTNNYISNYVSLKDSYTHGTIKNPIDAKRDIVQLKLLVLIDQELRIVQPAYKSFTDLGGSSVPAFMVSNPVTMGDTIRRKDIPYIWTHFYRTEDGFEDDGTGDWIPTNPSGCLLSARWDFSDNVISGKWSTPMQVYRLAKDYMPEDINDPFTYGHNIITTKSNLPGSGKAVSIKIESDGDKDLQILGWGAEVAITGAV